MAGRGALGAADVNDDRLAGLVAAQLRVPHVELLTSDAEVAAYDLDALTTAGRYWVRVRGRNQCGGSTVSNEIEVIVP